MGKTENDMTILFGEEGRIDLAGILSLNEEAEEPTKNTDNVSPPSSLCSEGMLHDS